jgi:hypothetical protein
MGWEGLYGRPLLLNGVARRPFLRLSTTMKSTTPGEAGDHKGLPIHPSSTLAPTDVDERGLRLMPLGRPLRSPSFVIGTVLRRGRQLASPCQEKPGPEDGENSTQFEE